VNFYFDKQFYIIFLLDRIYFCEHFDILFVFFWAEMSFIYFGKVSVIFWNFELKGNTKHTDLDLTLAIDRWDMWPPQLPRRRGLVKGHEMVPRPRRPRRSMAAGGQRTTAPPIYGLPGRTTSCFRFPPTSWARWWWCFSRGVTGASPVRGTAAVSSGQHTN
jgi:hypothetical protein